MAVADELIARHQFASGDGLSTHFDASPLLMNVNQFLAEYPHICDISLSDKDDVPNRGRLHAFGLNPLHLGSPIQVGFGFSPGANLNLQPPGFIEDVLKGLLP